MGEEHNRLLEILHPPPTPTNIKYSQYMVFNDILEAFRIRGWGGLVLGEGITLKIVMRTEGLE